MAVDAQALEAAARTERSTLHVAAAAACRCGPAGQSAGGTRSMGPAHRYRAWTENEPVEAVVFDPPSLPILPG